MLKNTEVLETDKLEERLLKHHRWDIYVYFWVVQMTKGLLEVNGSGESIVEAEHQATFTRSVAWLSLRINFYWESSNVKCYIWAGKSKTATTL